LQVAVNQARKQKQAPKKTVIAPDYDKQSLSYQTKVQKMKEYNDKDLDLLDKLEMESSDSGNGKKSLKKKQLEAIHDASRWQGTGLQEEYNEQVYREYMDPMTRKRDYHKELLKPPTTAKGKEPLFKKSTQPT